MSSFNAHSHSRPKGRRRIACFHDARWLTAGRIRVYASLMLAVSVISIVWLFTGGSEDQRGRAIGTDFVSFWSVSWALLNGHAQAIYDPTALAALEQAAVPHTAPAFYAWQYPPIALLLVYPLALLPYLWALSAWLIAGAAGYLSALWRINPQPLTLLLGLAFPAVLLTVTHGQNGFLTAALLTWGLLLLRHRPIVAGLLIAALSFKPQLALLLPVALIAGRHWQAIIAAGLTIVGLTLLTILIFGADVWPEFLASTAFAHQMLDLGLVPYFKMQSVFAAVRLAGGGLGFAYALQTLAAAGTAAVIAWIWRGPADIEIKAAAMLVATPLATPFVLDYDLMLLAPAIALVWRRIAAGGALAWERLAVSLAAVLPLIGRPIAEYTDVAIAPLALAAFLAVIAARCRAERMSRQPREQAVAAVEIQASAAPHG